MWGSGLGSGLMEKLLKGSPLPRGDSTSLSKGHFSVTVKPVLSPPSSTGFKRMQESVRCDFADLKVEQSMHLMVSLLFQHPENLSVKL